MVKGGVFHGTWSGARPRSPLAAFDARARVIAALLSLVVAFSASRSSPLPLALLTLFPLGALALSRAPAPWVMRRVGFVVPFVLLAALFTFVLPVSPRASGHRFWGLVLGGSFAVATAAWLSWTTTSAEAMDALARLRVPRTVVWTGMLGLRYLPVVFEEGRRVHRAASARGWTRREVRALAWMSASLLVRGFERALHTADAMEARGFGWGRVVREPRPWRLSDWALALGYPGVLLLVRLLVERVLP